MRLSDLVSIKHGFAFKSEFFSDSGDYVLLTPGSFFEEGGFRDQKSKTKYYVGDIPSGYILAKGQVLVAMTEQAQGLLGSAILVPENNKYLHNQRLGLVDIKDKSKVFGEYLYFYFNSEKFRRQIQETASGTKVRHTSPNKISDCEIELPPLVEQKKAAHILSTWDQAIEAVEELTDKKNKQKTSLLQWLYSTDAESWKKYEFGELVTLGKKKYNPLSSEDNYKCVELEHLSQNSGEIIGSVDSKGQSSIKSLFDPGQVLFGKLRPYLKKFALPNFRGVCSTEIWVFDANVDVTSNSFIFYLIQTHKFIYHSNVTSGTKMPRADWDYLSSITFAIPSKLEQKAFVERVSSVDEEIKLLKQKRILLVKQKKGLMQLLLTGKMRIT